MKENNFQLLELGFLASLVIILIAVIYITVGGDLARLLANFL